MANQNQKGDKDGSKNESDRSSKWKKELQEEGSRFVKSLMSQLKESVADSISEITQQNNAPPGLPSSIMGGRNSQSQDKRNGGGRVE